MLRRSSDTVQQPSEHADKSSPELDSPTREVVIDMDENQPSVAVEQNGSDNDGVHPPPPPPLLLAQSPIKTNGTNGDSSSGKQESHKCAGCGQSYRLSSELQEHKKSCPSNPEMSRTPSKTSGSVGSKCTMCSQVFSSMEAQIRHMTDFHKMKASFKCSFCRMSFGSKELIESHIKTHPQKSSSKSDKVEKPTVERVEVEVPESIPTSNEDNIDSIADEMEEVDCLVCGKTFKDPVEHREHEATCSGPQGIQNDSAMVGTEEYPEYFAHFKHDHINLVTDPENPYCMGCEKTMGSVLGICNHLSRRHDCRDWYCRNLAKEIKKADEKRKSDGVPRPEPRPGRTSPRGAYSRRSNPSSSHSNSPLLNDDQPPKRAASLLAQTHMKVASKGQIVEGYDDKTRTPKATSVPVSSSSKRPDGPHSIQCTNCQKVFDGRSPHVGFTNHQRGNMDCRERGTRRFITPNSAGNIAKAVSFTPIRNVSKPRHQESMVVELDDEESKSTQYFYCKICNDGDPKTRTSLGCHLTVHHGLPPVNCKNGTQDGFRCQTCCQMFNSKHYYNQHRHDCDMKSEYVGFCEATQTPSIKKPRVRNPAPAAVSSSTSSKNGFSCNLCGKTGFPGPKAVRIHVKYICVNREKPDANLVSKSLSSNPPRVPKLKIKTSTLPSAPRSPLETRSMRFRDSIPQNSDSPGKERGPKPELKCSDCGRGPYTTVHHLMEHQKNYCKALKRNLAQNGKRESVHDEDDEIGSSRAVKRFASEKINGSPREAELSAKGGDIEYMSGVQEDVVMDCSVCGTVFR